MCVPQPCVWPCQNMFVFGERNTFHLVLGKLAAKQREVLCTDHKPDRLGLLCRGCWFSRAVSSQAEKVHTEYIYGYAVLILSMLRMRMRRPRQRKSNSIKRAPLNSCGWSYSETAQGSCLRHGGYGVCTTLHKVVFWQVH